MTSTSMLRRRLLTFLSAVAALLLTGVATASATGPYTYSMTANDGFLEADYVVAGTFVVGDATPGSADNYFSALNLDTGSFNEVHLGCSNQSLGAGILNSATIDVAGELVSIVGVGQNFAGSGSGGNTQVCDSLDSSPAVASYLNSNAENEVDVLAETSDLGKNWSVLAVLPVNGPVSVNGDSGVLGLDGNNILVGAGGKNTTAAYDYSLTTKQLTAAPEDATVPGQAPYSWTQGNGPVLWRELASGTVWAWRAHVTRSDSDDPWAAAQSVTFGSFASVSTRHKLHLYSWSPRTFPQPGYYVRVGGNPLGKYCPRPPTARAVGLSQVLLSDSGSVTWALSAQTSVSVTCASHSMRWRVPMRLLRSTDNGQHWTPVTTPAGKVTQLIATVGDEPVLVTGKSHLWRLQGRRWVSLGNHGATLLNGLP